MILMTRPTVEEWALEILRATQARATCDRGRCSALILKDNRILASGYVGSPQGLPHCDDVGHDFQETWVDTEAPPSDPDGFYMAESGRYLVKKKSCIRTIHAEQNAIAWAAREGIALKGGTMYSTGIQANRVCRSEAKGDGKLVRGEHPSRTADQGGIRCG